jgi:hypothetical protein
MRGLQGGIGKSRAVVRFQTASAAMSDSQMPDVGFGTTLDKALGEAITLKFQAVAAV